MIGILGPTASGKTALAERLADSLDAQLLSADAFLVYRGFDIGTAKPDRRSEYEFIDVREPTDAFGVGEYVVLANTALERLFSEGRDAIVVGGTGLYIRALFEEYADLAESPKPELRAEIQAELADQGVDSLWRRLRELDPEAARKVDATNPRRIQRALERTIGGAPNVTFRLPPFVQTKFGLAPSAAELDRSISERLSAMMQRGFEDEVGKLVAGGLPGDAPAMQAIGYRTIAQMLAGSLSRDEAIARIEIETRQYAKRQRTWLRSEPNLMMIDSESLEGRMQTILERLH